MHLLISNIDISTVIIMSIFDFVNIEYRHKRKMKGRPGRDGPNIMRNFYFSAILQPMKLASSISRKQDR